MKKSTAGQIGFWSSVFVSLFGIIYLFVLILHFSSAGIGSLPSPFVKLAAGIITFLTASGLVILFTAIKYVNDGKNEVLGSLGISFIILYAATVSINRFVQLTVIQQNLPDVPADLTRFLPYGEGSVMFSLEMLGWGFFSSLAFLFVAPIFSATRLNKTIRWLFALYAILSFLSVIGFSTNTAIVTVGLIAWGPILLALTVLLCVYFRNCNEQ